MCGYKALVWRQTSVLSAENNRKPFCSDLSHKSSEQKTEDIDQPDRLSGEESDDYVMRVYNQMIEKETNGQTGSVKKKRGPKSARERNEAIQRAREAKRKSEAFNKTKTKVSEDTNEIEELREENKRLQALIDRYERESKTIINKACDLKRRERTSVLQLLELFRLNSFLVQHLPDSERVLEEYLTTKCDESQTSAPKESTNRKSILKPFKSPVTPISNYFRAIDKPTSNKSVGSRATNGNTSSEYLTESDSKKRKLSVTPSLRKSPRKRSSALTYKSSDDEDDNMVRTKSVSSATNKSTSKTNSSDNEKDSPEKSKPGPKKRVSSATKKMGDEDKPKRQRRKRVEEPKGYFPCTFDPRQCDAIMDTKKNFDFHMTGHFEAKYVCPHCAYTGPTIEIIKRHVKKERELASEREKSGKPLSDDLKDHHKIKIYQCFGCKVCDKMHKKFETRCEHILEDEDNQCDFAHDIDYEFKDHLKMHFSETFRHMKNKEEKKDKIRVIADKFVDELYFENRAKTDILVKKFQESTSIPKQSKGNKKESDEEDNCKSGRKDKDKPIALPDDPNESESDWSDSN